MVGRRVLLVVLCMVFLVPVSALGQEAVTMEIDFGVDGYVQPGLPIEATATVTAEVLFTGFIEMRRGNAATRVPVEVPSGSNKQYNIVVPPSEEGAPNRIRLLDRSFNEVVRVDLNAKVAGSTVLVGVVDAPVAAAGLGRTRTEIDAIPVEVIELEEIERGPAPLGYLVWGRAAPIPERVETWLRAGGRLIVDRFAWPSINLDARPLGGIGDLDWLAVGQGEVMVFDDLDRAPEEWARNIRPTQVAMAQQHGIAVDDKILRQGANALPGRQLAAWWVGLAVLIYGLIVAPVNFFVLRAIGKKELAWITVPLLSLIAVAAFWIVGRSRVGGSQLGHASLVVAGLDGRVTTSSSVIVAAGRAIDHNLGFNDATTIYSVGPPEWVGAGPVEPVVLTGEGAHIGFSELGAVSIRVDRPTGPALPIFRSEGNGTLIIENATPYVLSGYGPLSAFEQQFREPLAPGASASFRTDAPIQGFGCFDCFFEVDGLIGAALSVAGHNALYASTETMALEIELDGRRRTITGPGIFVIPLDAAGTGGTWGRAIAAPRGTFEGMPNTIVAEWVTVGFEVPLRTSIAVDRPLGGNFRISAWHWEQGRFQRIEEGSLDASFVAVNGEVVLKLEADTTTGSEPFVTSQSVRLTWDQA